MTTDWTAEDVDVIIDDAPASTISRLTVKGIAHLLLGKPHRTSQMFFINKCRYDLLKTNKQTNNNK